MILNNFQKIFKKSFFGGGVTKGQKFFFRFLAVSGHSESILIFSDFLQNRSDRGGGGAGGDQKSSFAIKPALVLRGDFIMVPPFRLGTKFRGGWFPPLKRLRGDCPLSSPAVSAHGTNKI